MKNIMIIIICICSFIGYGQSESSQVLPIEKFMEMGYADIKEGTYFKDINNVLSNYIGKWTGNRQDKDFEIVVEKVTNTSKIGADKIIKEDHLLLRYKIKVNSIEVINTLTLSKDNGLIVDGYHLYDKGDFFDYYFIYGGKEIKCGQSGDILLRTTGDPDKLKLKLYPDGGIILDNECPDGLAEQVFPTDEWLILKKEK